MATVKEKPKTRSRIKKKSNRKKKLKNRNFFQLFFLILIFIVIVATSTYYLLHYVVFGFDKNFIQIKRCIDNGGKWDYDRASCKNIK